MQQQEVRTEQYTSPALQNAPILGFCRCSEGMGCVCSLRAVTCRFRSLRKQRHHLPFFYIHPALFATSAHGYFINNQPIVAIRNETRFRSCLFLKRFHPSPCFCPPSLFDLSPSWRHFRHMPVVLRRYIASDDYLAVSPSPLLRLSSVHVSFSYSPPTSMS